MGHAIKTMTFDISMSPSEILNECNENANYDGADYRDPIGNIRYVDKVLDNLEAAEKYIESIDRGWYDQIAVKYKVPIQKPDTAAIKKMVDKIQELRDTWRLRDFISYANTVTADFFSCRHCKSKFNRSFMMNRGNICPVCGGDMRSETILKQLNKLSERIEDMNTKIKDARLKNSSGFKTKYLVKIEYHV